MAAFNDLANFDQAPYDVFVLQFFLSHELFGLLMSVFDVTTVCLH